MTNSIGGCVTGGTAQGLVIVDTAPPPRIERGPTKPIEGSFSWKIREAIDDIINDWTFPDDGIDIIALLAVSRQRFKNAYEHGTAKAMERESAFMIALNLLYVYAERLKDADNDKPVSEIRPQDVMTALL